MTCPRCGGELQVVDSRNVRQVVRRRRKCRACGDRFTTYEQIKPFELVVRKRDGRRQPFDRDKIVRLLERMLARRKVRPGLAQELATQVERALAASDSIEIASRHVATLVVELLAEHDPVAARGFAVWYEDEPDPAVAEAASGRPPPRQLDLEFPLRRYPRR